MKVDWGLFVASDQSFRILNSGTSLEQLQERSGPCSAVDSALDF